MSAHEKAFIVKLKEAKVNFLFSYDPEQDIQS